MEPALEIALYSPPSCGAMLDEIRPDLAAKLATADDRALEAIAARWAAAMSTPKYTHSVTGVRICDGWSPADALDLLQPIVALIRQASSGQRLYLLVEAWPSVYLEC